MTEFESQAGCANAVSCIDGEAQEARLPTALVSAASGYIAAARAPRTRKSYASSWAGFAAWCRDHGRQSLPASVETVAAWMASLAKTGKAPATINTYLASVVVAHRTAGYALDRKNPLIADIWKGIRNETSRAQRQARPLAADELRSLIAGMGSVRLADKRDGALIALGWAGALRRSELTGLDWQEPGTGNGTLSLDERGLVVTLYRSKTSQSEAVTIVVPCQDMPAACSAVADWAKAANLQPGEPVFRRVIDRKRLTAEPLTDRSVSRIIKARVRFHAITRGKSKAEADELASMCSGHSLRAGYATAAAQADLPTHRIMQHTRHKSAEMVCRYIRESDKWTKSGLKGVGF